MRIRTTLTVCRTCRPGDSGPQIEPPGAALGRCVRDAIARLDTEGLVEARAIACLSSCGRACSATVAAPGKFSYVVGGLEPADAEALVIFALRHAESVDGVTAWRERPEKIRKNTVARVPPPGADHALVERVPDAETVSPDR